MKNKTRREFRFGFIVQAAIIILMLTAFIPVFLMIILSFKTNAEVYSNFICTTQNS